MAAAVETAPPAAIVIFGASGDLANRKLLPALRSLADQGLLHRGTVLIGVGRSDLGDDGWRKAIDAVGGHEGWRRVCEHARWVTGSQDDTALFDRLADVLAEADEVGAAGNRLFYLAVPPSAFGPTVVGLGKAGLTEPPGDFARVVIEKPFGVDLVSSRALDAELHTVLGEDQIYRIDHYLGKETVQNVLAFRFANAIFEPIWNRRYIDSVQLTIAESVGVEGRAAFYDHAGALRDIVQNHGLQVLAMTAMEPPVSTRAEAIRDEKVKLLESIEILDPDVVGNDVVRGRYRGYEAEDGVDPDSRTETFVAMRLHVDNWRWAGVPFYLRTGKRLPARVTEVVLRFQRVPHLPFAPTRVRQLGPNELVLRIQPDEGISLCFGAKVPGPAFDVRTVAMDMTWSEEFGAQGPDAYERLLHDALAGDPTLFIRSDEVAAAWQVVAPVQQAWGDDDSLPVAYEPGTWGPAEADRLLARDGRSWRTPRF